MARLSAQAQPLPSIADTPLATCSSTSTCLRANFRPCSPTPCSGPSKLHRKPPYWPGSPPWDQSWNPPLPPSSSEPLDRTVPARPDLYFLHTDPEPWQELACRRNLRDHTSGLKYPLNLGFHALAARSRFG